MGTEYNLLSKIKDTVDNARNEISGYVCFQGLDKSLSAIPQRMAEPMQLAIVGKISSSKSTLVNTILGQPEVVRTGAMEETWNVSWLKYGDPQGDIIVKYKDGTQENVSRNQWAEWANRDRTENEKLKNSVLYIEVTYNHEVLKNINIIDTPGLDSFYRSDSKNTLDFLKFVKPDAVIMLFSKSINADTLSVIEDFRQGIGAGFSPINTLGIMSKIDDIWISDPESEPLVEATRVINGLMSQEVVKNTLFNIFPISALVALSAYRITLQDIDLMRQLSMMEEGFLTRIFKSEKRFVQDYPEVSVSPAQREYLLATYGRYVIWVIIEQLKQNEDVSLGEIRETLLKKSGFNPFSDILSNHFGERSSLIKIYSSIFSISSTCRTLYADHRLNPAEKLIISKVTKNVDELIRTLILSFNIIDISTLYYKGELDIDEPDFEELRRINGEFGVSCQSRLNMGDNQSVEDMIQKSISRIEYWTIIYNTEGIEFPSEAAFYKLMINTYILLLKDMQSAKQKLDSASFFLFGR